MKNAGTTRRRCQLNGSDGNLDREANLNMPSTHVGWKVDRLFVCQREHSVVLCLGNANYSAFAGTLWTQGERGPVLLPEVRVSIVDPVGQERVEFAGEELAVNILDASIGRHGASLSGVS